jgi:hypothetical protein
VPRPARQAPPPLRVDTVRVVLGDRVDRMWTWTCVAGIALAGVGLGVMRLQGQIGRRR